MNNATSTYERSSVSKEEIPSLMPMVAVQKVGGRAIEHFAETFEQPRPEDIAPPEGFDHLFPATLLPAELIHSEASTAEGAERLLDKLDDDNPYKDYAASHLALHFMNQGNILHAYELLHTIRDSGTATHVLSQLVMYKDDHHIDTLPIDQLGPELHELAMTAYDGEPSIKNAYVVREASEALPNDKELRLYAHVVSLEHPEVVPDMAHPLHKL